MVALALMSFTGFSGYAVLLPVAPLWAVHGGASAAGSGLVNGVMLACTVLTQLLMPGSLRRFGWGPVLTAGMVLLGLPAMAYRLSDALAPVLALSAVRGVGFGVLTVTGSAAVARLATPGRLGEAIGAYGLAIAVPNLVLLPLGPWLAAHAGFLVTFLISGLPLVGIPAALRLAAAVEAAQPGPQESRATAPVASRTAHLRLVRPTVLLMAVTLAGGAVITFAPQMVDSAGVATLGLFLMGLVAAAVRWRAGAFADRHGAGPFVWPLIAVTAVGMALTAAAVTDRQHTTVWLFLVAAVVVGTGYGALQNLTLVMAFDAVPSRFHNLASAIWNVGFDTGTGLGSVAVGVIAARSSFSTGLVAVALLCTAALPLAVRKPPIAPAP